MTCGANCRYGSRNGGHTDAAKRIYDAVNLNWTFHQWDSVGTWMAFKLEDGTSDYTMYPTKRDAVRHVSNELHYTFIKLHPGGMNLCEAEIMLQFARQASKAGFRLADPDTRNGGRDLIPRITSTNIQAQIRALMRGKM